MFVNGDRRKQYVNKIQMKLNMIEHPPSGYTSYSASTIVKVNQLQCGNADIKPQNKYTKNVQCLFKDGY